MIVTLDEPKALCPNFLLPANQALPVLLGGDWTCHSVFLPYSFHEYPKDVLSEPRATALC